MIPNWVDVEQLDRTKLPGAALPPRHDRHRRERASASTSLSTCSKRIRRHDDRFILFAKSKMPWEYPWIWRRPGEQRTDSRRRSGGSRTPRGCRARSCSTSSVPTSATWLRRIGFVLSTSDDESFHLAPAEGMASGAVPVIRNWPGADTIFDPMWIRGDATEMADTILETVGGERWEAAGEVAREQIRSSYSLERVVSAWTELLGQDSAW